MGFNMREFDMVHELAMYGIAAMAVLAILCVTGGVVLVMRVLKKGRP